MPRARSAASGGAIEMIGISDVARLLREQISQAARVDSTVLLLGPTGTGKDLAAKAIHYNSDRANKPFVNITCSALSEQLLESELFGHERGAFTDARQQKRGLFETADSGTVFLDEIGEMAPGLQAKLLRFLQEKTFKRVGGLKEIRVDVRIIAATNIDVPQAIADKKFREDLYYRLGVIRISMPPLANRKDDIPTLVEHFLRQHSAGNHRFGLDAIEQLRNHDWPGNVRELENLVERTIHTSPNLEIRAEDIVFLERASPGPTPAPPRTRTKVRQGEPLARDTPWQRHVPALLGFLSAYRRVDGRTQNERIDKAGGASNHPRHAAFGDWGRHKCIETLRLWRTEARTHAFTPVFRAVDVQDPSCTYDACVRTFVAELRELRIATDDPELDWLPFAPHPPRLLRSLPGAERQELVAAIKARDDAYGFKNVTVSDVDRVEASADDRDPPSLAWRVATQLNAPSGRTIAQMLIEADVKRFVIDGFSPKTDREGEWNSLLRVLKALGDRLWIVLAQSINPCHDQILWSNSTTIHFTMHSVKTAAPHMLRVVQELPACCLHALGSERYEPTSGCVRELTEAGILREDRDGIIPAFPAMIKHLKGMSPHV